MKKFWKCKICGNKNREFGSYHGNIGLSSSVSGEHICIKCVNQGMVK